MGGAAVRLQLAGATPPVQAGPDLPAAARSATCTAAAFLCVIHLNVLSAQPGEVNKIQVLGLEISDCLEEKRRHQDLRDVGWVNNEVVTYHASKVCKERVGQGACQHYGARFAVNTIRKAPRSSVTVCQVP